MQSASSRFYEFGPFRVDTAKRLLLREGEPVYLSPKAFDTLIVLVEHAGEVLEKDRLMDLLWPDSSVEEANLPLNISALRKALGETPNERGYITTIPGRGYRFGAAMQVLGGEEPDLIIERRQRATVLIREHDLSGEIQSYSNERLLPATASANSRFEQGASSVRSIAVLPFKPLISDQRDEFLELGMADALITKLANIRQIIVRPTSAVLKYSDGNQDPLVAGREQGVDALLEGRVQRSGDRIRVTVQLVRVSDGKPLWADKFDEKSTHSIFSIQDSISQQVARALVPKLTGEEQRQLTKRYTDDTEAYNLYLMGRFFWSRFNDDGLTKAIEYFNQAIAVDPQYALAYTGLANAYIVQGGIGLVPPAENWSKAKWSAEKAVELDDTLAKSHQALAGVRLMYEWDWSAAERELTRAIELNPADGEPHNLYAYYYQATGQLDKALSEMRRAQELAPLSSFINSDVAFALYYQGNYEEAINVYRNGEEMDPHFGPSPLFLLAQIYEQKGEYDRAIAECQKAFAIFGRDPGILAVLGYTYAVSGKHREAKSILAEIEGRWKRRYFSPIDVALIYAGLGDKDGAFAWLGKAYEARDPQLIWVNVEPELKSLRADTRFKDLLHRMNLAQ